MDNQDFPHQVVFEQSALWNNWFRDFATSEIAILMRDEHLPWLQENCPNGFIVTTSCKGPFLREIFMITYAFKNLDDATLFRLRF